MINERREACIAIIDILENKKKCDTVLHNLFSEKELSKQQRAFVNQLVYGTVERQIELDYVINQFAKTKTNKMKPYVRNVLRLSVYQLLYMNSAKPFAVCDEAVKLVVKRGYGGLRGFVNGVLRTITRELDHISYPDKEKDFVQYAHIHYSMPIWIVEMWTKQYGKEKTTCMLDYFYQPKELTIRVNQSVVSVEEVRERLVSCGVTVEQGHIFPYALRISHYDSVERLPGFSQGWFAVQDESSMMVSHCAGIEQGMTVVDVCSAPGGKAMHAADLLNGTGRLFARDLTDFKITKIKDNCKRMRIKQIDVKCQDAREEEPELVGCADIVIADVPCSGLGVIGKKADIKYGADIDKCKELQKLQREILTNVVRYVKPGGILMYSTCTVNAIENEDNLKWLKETYPSFSSEPLQVELSKNEGSVQILPGEYGTDGFYVAKLRKEK